MWDLWAALRLRLHQGWPLRYSMAFVVVLGVSAPALLFVAGEQYLVQQAQHQILEQAETSLLSLGSGLVAEPMWAINQAALEIAAGRLLENPQVVALRIDDHLVEQSLLRLRPGYRASLPEQTQAGRLRQRTQVVSHDAMVLGTLTLWFDQKVGQGLLQQRRNQMWWLVAAQVLLSLAVVLPLLVVRVLQPIERLKAQASGLLLPDATAQPTVDFVWTRQDEIGLLGQHLLAVKQQLRELFGQLERSNAQLQQLALYDHLTGLPNRLLFADLVQREMQQARRSRQKFSIFFIDLDRFKVVNDTLGHAAGDTLLLDLSDRLQHTVREADVVCRHSGDEFLVLVRDITSWEAMGDLASRLIQAIEQPVDLGQGQSAHVSASIGITLFPDDAEEFEALVRNADIAMYQAKLLGRARYSFFHAELNARLQAHLELEHELEQAIATNQFVLHYQPQVDARSGQLVGVEALVRWQHPRHGLLYPGSFIGMAEDSGKIAALGLWTLHAACRQLADWQARGLNVGVVAVNVSALEFRDHRLLDSVQAALDANSLSPSALEIEITESVLMAETDTSQRIMAGLRARGVGTAIDDFGTGYSSLSYLKRLKPNQLKIDRAFVSDATSDQDSRAIVQGVIGLANALGLNVVAEGVETLEQLLLLRELGCHTVQGYFLSKPLTAMALEQWLQRGEHTNHFV